MSHPAIHERKHEKALQEQTDAYNAAYDTAYDDAYRIWKRNDLADVLNLIAHALMVADNLHDLDPGYYVTSDYGDDLLAAIEKCEGRDASV